MSVIRILGVAGISLIGISGIGIWMSTKGPWKYKFKLSSYKKTASKINSNPSFSTHKNEKNLKVPEPDDEWWKIKWQQSSPTILGNANFLNMNEGDSWEDFRDRCYTKMEENIKELDKSENIQESILSSDSYFWHHCLKG